MARNIFPAGTLTATGKSYAVTLHPTSTSRKQVTDIYSVTAADELDDGIPSGRIIVSATGTYARFAGPEDVSGLWAQPPGGGARTKLTATSSVADSTGLTSDTATYPRADAIVRADGTGSHTTLEAAIAAVPAGGVILVDSDLTVAPAAGAAAFVINKALTIDFRGGPGRTTRRIFNTGDGDVFSSGVAIGANGQVNGVEIRSPYVTASGFTQTTLGTGLTLTASADTIGATAHGLPAGKCVQLANIVSATGVTASKTYFVVNPTANTFQLSTRHGGSAVDITADGTADVTVLARSAGRAFQMHGTYHWDVRNYFVTGHAVGVYMDATPYPSGQCSHNVFDHGLITACGIGVQNDGSANINTWSNTNISNCDVRAVLHQSGLNPVFNSLRVENLQGYTGTLIDAQNSGLSIFGLHAEAQGATPALNVAAGTTGTTIFGDIYVTTGTKYAIADGARYVIGLKDEPLKEHSSTRASRIMTCRLGDITASGTVTIGSMPVTARIKALRFLPGGNGFVNYGASDYWVLTWQMWNGNTFVENIPGAVYTQSAQIGVGPNGVTGLDYVVQQDRVIRCNFGKNGAAVTFSAPLMQIEYDVN